MSAMQALELARAAWERSQPQLFLDFEPSAPGGIPLPSGDTGAGYPRLAAGAEPPPAVASSLPQARDEAAGIYVGEPTADQAPPGSLRDPDRRADGSRRGSSPTNTSNGVSAQSFPAVARPPRKGV